jgi:hypothetical protein
MTEQIEHARRSRSIPPGLARIPPESCRRRWAQSIARSGRHGPLPIARADARAATSRGRRTSGGSGPAAGRPVRSETGSGCGAAQRRAKPPAWFRRGGGSGPIDPPVATNWRREPCAASACFSPPPAREARGGVRGEQGSLSRSGVLQQVQCQHANASSRRHPHPPTPPRRFAGGGEGGRLTIP